MTTAAHRRVHDQSGGNGEEQFDDLPPHHRDMVEPTLHVESSRRRAPGRRAGSFSSPPIGRRQPGCLPRAWLRLKAGGVGANNRASRGAGDGPGSKDRRVVNVVAMPPVPAVLFPYNPKSSTAPDDIPAA